MKSSRMHNMVRHVTRFLAGQAMVQLLNLTMGLLLLRWLSLTAYAQYSVVFAFQTMLNQLVDVGFTNSIVALVGERQHDRRVIGSLIRAAKYFRSRMFVAMAAVAAVAFPLVTERQHWGVTTKVLLFSAVVTSVFFQRKMMYAAPLLMGRVLGKYYGGQLVAAVTRAFACLLLYKLGILSATAAAWIGSLSIAINGFLYEKNARPIIEEPEQIDAEYNREMLSYIRPLIPGLLFTTFQGQIAIALITIMGRTQSIAEVAALGRLNQLFLMLTAANLVIIEPMVARVKRGAIAGRYLQILAIAITIAVLVTGFAFAFPKPLVWILGHNYRHLIGLVAWMVMASCVSYVATVIWTMNNARKYLSWAYTASYIVCTLIVQAVWVSRFGAASTDKVIGFYLASNVTMAVVHLIAGLLGVRKEMRESPKPVYAVA